MIFTVGELKKMLATEADDTIVVLRSAEDPDDHQFVNSVCHVPNNTVMGNVMGRPEYFECLENEWNLPDDFGKRCDRVMPNGVLILDVSDKHYVGKLIATAVSISTPTNRPFLEILADIAANEDEEG